MTRVWWELNLVFWRKENLWHARGKAVSPGIESLLQGRGRPLPSCPFTSTCCSCWGRWGDIMSRLHFLFHHKPPSPTSVNEKCPPGSGKTAGGTDMMWKWHRQEGPGVGAEGEWGQGAMENSGIWGRNHCWERRKQTWHLKQPELWQNRTSGRTNTFLLLLIPNMYCQS